MSQRRPNRKKRNIRSRVPKQVRCQRAERRLVDRQKKKRKSNKWEVVYVTAGLAIAVIVIFTLTGWLRSHHEHEHHAGHDQHQHAR